MGMEDLCNTGLNLGLGSMPPTNDPQNPPNKVAAAAAVSVSSFEPPYLTLALSAGAGDNNNLLKKKDTMMMMEEAVVVADQYPYGRQGSPHSSALSSFSVKRERDLSSEEVEAAERPLLYGEEDDGINNNARKKLRLTKEQSALLEESFKHHSTLNPKQKQALARQLNLRPRQVEVWFQNRRARTKLKQTEVDCELLKKWCESLTEDNRRLQKEVQALKSSSTPPPQPPFYMHVPSPTLTMCPSCSERITITKDGATTTNSAAAAAAANDNNNNTPLLFSPTKHFYNNPFINNPSAAC